MSEILPRLLRHSNVKLACFGLSSVAAVYLGFLGIEVGFAAILVKRFGYYFILVTFALWIGVLFRLWRRRARGDPLNRREWLLAGLAIALLSSVAIASESFRSKVLFDEFVLQSTAYNMHYFREASTMVRGYDVLGVFISTDSYLDKRPIFFPFLISLVHDLTGYRTANAYLLNALLLPITLGLAYYIGRRLNGQKGGLLAVLLLGSLPLLGQNATGSGMELLNVAMILIVIGLCGAFIRQADELRLSALVLGTVLLAQARYESAIYVAPVALAVAREWWRKRSITLSWLTILAPLLLLPSALQNRVLSNSRWMWELKENQDTRFSLDYFPSNVRAAGEFFFNGTPSLANSWPLAVVGTLAISYGALHTRRLREFFLGNQSDRTAILLLGLGIITNTVLIMFYYWSALTDPLASRLSLPFYLLLTFFIVMAAACWDKRLPASLILLGSMTIFALGVTTSHASMHVYSHLGIDEIEWEKRYLAALPDGERLVMVNTSSIPFLLVKIPAVLINGRVGLVTDRLKYQLDRHVFTEILVFQSMRPTTAEGDHELVPEDKLPPSYQLQLLVEKRFGSKIVKVSRLIAINQTPSVQINNLMR